MPSAMTALANITLGSAQATVTFSSISGAYRDLRIVIRYGVNADADTTLQFNSDTGSNYSWVNMRGNGSSAASTASASSVSNIALGLQSVTVPTTFTTQATVDIMDYSATDKHKTALIRADDASAQTIAKAGRWANTAAITTVVLGATGTTFQTGSTFSLYGIAS